MVFKLALLLHIIGALGLISAMVLHLLAAVALRKAATVGQIKEQVGLISKIPSLIGPSSLLILLSGLYLSVVLYLDDHPIGWIIVALATFLAIGAYNSSVGKKTAKTLQPHLKKNTNTLSSELKSIIRNRQMVDSSIYGIWGFLGILTLMVYRPGWLISIIIILAALVAGLLTAKRLKATTQT